jgi:hypothetical protein
VSFAGDGLVDDDSVTGFANLLSYDDMVIYKSVQFLDDQALADSQLTSNPSTKLSKNIVVRGRLTAGQRRGRVFQHFHGHNGLGFGVGHNEMTQGHRRG